MPKKTVQWDSQENKPKKSRYTRRKMALADSQPAGVAITNAFGYNVRSEVTSALMGTNAYGYVFDPIGNRIVATNNAEVTSYAANELNQYTNILCASAPQREPSHDDDGNMLTNGVWSYVWDGENRLRSVSSNNVLLATHTYDHQSRRVGKVSHEDAKTRSYVYDGWNLIQELTHTQAHILTNFYVWGLDLSGSLQGAGGVGGLLAVVKNSATYIPAWDANGNIMEYVADDGTIAAHREYDPFGGTVVATGDAIAFTHWFSTKPWCAVTGLSEYQFRMYSPEVGRWLSRDPIGEKGGVALYVLCFNRALLSADALGLKSDEMPGLLDLFDIGMSPMAKITHIDLRVYRGLSFYKWEEKECKCYFRDAYQVRKIQKVKKWKEVWAVVKTPGELIQGMSEDAALEALVGELSSTLGTLIGVSLIGNNFVNYDLTQKPDNAHELFRIDEKEYEDSYTIGSWVDNTGEPTTTFSLTPEGCLDPELIAYDSYREIDHLFSWDVESGDYNYMNGLLMNLENQYLNNNWGGYP